MYRVVVLPPRTVLVNEDGSEAVLLRLSSLDAEAFENLLEGDGETRELTLPDVIWEWLSWDVQDVVEDVPVAVLEEFVQLATDYYPWRKCDVVLAWVPDEGEDD